MEIWRVLVGEVILNFQIWNLRVYGDGRACQHKTWINCIGMVGREYPACMKDPGLGPLGI